MRKRIRSFSISVVILILTQSSLIISGSSVDIAEDAECDTQQMGSSVEINDSNCFVFGKVHNIIFFMGHPFLGNILWWLDQFAVGTLLSAFINLFISKVLSRIAWERGAVVVLGLSVYDYNLNRYFNYTSEGKIWSIGSEGVVTWDGGLIGGLSTMNVDLKPLFRYTAFVGMMEFRGMKLTCLNYPGSDAGLSVFLGFTRSRDN